MDYGPRGYIPPGGAPPMAQQTYSNVPPPQFARQANLNTEGDTSGGSKLCK